MATAPDLFTARKGLGEICSVPDRIISVYSLEQHVWAEGNSAEAQRKRQPELKTIEEFQIDPVRPFLNDILRNMAAPYKPERKDNPIGQGYWIQAEFGSGKSHLLCFLSALTLGSQPAWDLVNEKEKQAGRGKRDSVYRFWEEGLQAKCSDGKRGTFVIVKTLVGAGSGTVGLNDRGHRLSEYILDAAKEQLQIELGKNLSLYPVEILADRFLKDDLERYRIDLKKFLKDPVYFDEDEYEELDDFVRDIQQNKDPEYKRSCGNKLWRFYTEYLKVQPHIEAETEDILKHMVETILAEGYTGVLLVLDEVSLFMKNRDEDQRTDDEQTLVVLANRLAKVHNLPLWTICSAQQAIESKMGVKNIIADDRLKLVKLLENDKDYYDIVLARVRTITEPGAIPAYYLHYKRGFTWPNAIGEQEFAHFFPFHKPALEVLRSITYELTTTRSAIHFMHQTLKHQIKAEGTELIRLWELFDEAVNYEEDPSGVHAGLVAIKTKRETDYRAYEACRRQIDGMTKGHLKVFRDKAVKTLQTLFLYHIARTRQQGITTEEIANSVLIERDASANPEENNQHYETLAENLRKELRQIVQTFDEEKRPRYKFDPVFTGVDPRLEFDKARNQAEANEVMQREAWEHLLALGDWTVKTRQVTVDLANGVRSTFREIAPVSSWTDSYAAKPAEKTLDVTWQGRQVSGTIVMKDLAKVANSPSLVPAINSDETDLDFAVVVGLRSVSTATLDKALAQVKDPRVLVWSPDELTPEERERLLDFAAYRKLVKDWQGKDTEDAAAVINWVSNSLQTGLAQIAKIVDGSYGRGRIDARNNSQMDFRVAGELTSILSPLVGRVLSAAYESRDIKFEPPFVFRKEEAVKVINGIVKAGSIPKGAKPNQEISAAQNFGFGLKLIKKSAEKQLDVSDNPYVQAMWAFVDDKLADESQSMKVETLYKNFTGIGGPKDFGLSRRMVQIYLLCLVQQGKVRVGLGAKSGLPLTAIDYATIAGIDFSAKVLDNLGEVQKVARPQNWEVLRPYAEKLLGRSIPSTNDDALISQSRAELRNLLAAEKDEAARARGKAKDLFDALRAENPYETELGQVAALFATDLSDGNDIDLLRYALKECLGYAAFDNESVAQTEVDDLANRLKNYRDTQHLLRYETELRVARAYCDHTLPDLAELKDVREDLRVVDEKLAALRPFVDSDVKLVTELVGHAPPDPKEKGTIASLIRRYTTAYASLHDSILSQTDGHRQAVLSLKRGEEMRALKVLEGVSALRPAVSAGLEQQLAGLAAGIFSCPSPSVSSLQQQLRAGPVHECQLTFANALQLLAEAAAAAAKGRALFDSTLEQKLAVFLSPAIKERLAQGRHEPAIALLLECEDLPAVRAYLLKACLEDNTLVEAINRYLKLVVIKLVKVTDFQPSTRTVEKSQIADLAIEFQQFLEDQLASLEQGEDTLPMLQVE